MDEMSKDMKNPAERDDLRAVIRSVIDEYATSERQRSEVAYKTELTEERKRREQLERRVNELVEDAKMSRKLAEEADRHGQIRSELQRLGVSKVDLAFRIVRDEIARAEDGSLMRQSGEGATPMKEYLNRFVSENPEFLPARISGGAGTLNPPKQGGAHPGAVDLDRIKPGMSAEELQRVREQISQVALETMRGE